MIRSSVDRLVEAAIRELTPDQIVLFVQNFGTPINSMSKLLALLDHAVIEQFDTKRCANDVTKRNENTKPATSEPIDWKCFEEVSHQYLSSLPISGRQIKLHKDRAPYRFGSNVGVYLKEKIFSAFRFLTGLWWKQPAKHPKQWIADAFHYWDDIRRSREAALAEHLLPVYRRATEDALKLCQGVINVNKIKFQQCGNEIVSRECSVVKTYSQN
uniref:Integrator complex subunit 1 INTS2-binding domain-containing protein n=1 Tax=Glossina austeni TaxID=7395 RepID=A0A1A9UCQ7_GLOAU